LFAPHQPSCLAPDSRSPVVDLDGVSPNVICAFGWADILPHRFLIRGGSFAGSNGSEASPCLSEFRFRLGERFFYDLRFQDGQTPTWRHQIRLEKIVEAERAASFRRCSEGRGGPQLGQASNPAELADLSELFTPRYMGFEEHWNRTQV